MITPPRDPAKPEVFIVEATTRLGKVCESFSSYQSALHRINQLAADGLVGTPLVFKELADGSQRLVRGDGKPLQWHRLPDDSAAAPCEPIPLSDSPLEAPPIVPIEEPLPLVDWDESNEKPRV